MSKNFPLSEMQFSPTAIRLGLDNTCPQELMHNMERVENHLEDIRANFGNKPVKVLSCYRSPEVNAAVGGSKTSAHRYALAADFVVSGHSVDEVARWCAENIKDYDQVISEFQSWVHLGFTEKVPRRQVLTAKKVNGKTVYTRGLA